MRWLSRQIAPASLDQDKLTRLLDDLNAAGYQRREQATAALIAMGRLARPHLLERQDGPGLTAEARMRIRRILGQTQYPDYGHPENRRAARAVAAMKAIGTAEARAVLQRWSGGAEGALLTELAADALERPQGDKPPADGKPRPGQ